MHSVAHSVHNFHQIFSEFREIILDVASMEIRHMIVEAVLQRCCLLIIPRGELLRGIGRELAVFVDFQHGVKNHLHRLKPEGRVDYRSESRRHSTHKVSVGKHRVAKARTRLCVFDSSGLDDVADFHIRGTCHFTSFAVKTIFQSLVIEIRLLQSIAFPVRTGLLRPGIVGIERSDRTIHSADGAFYAVLEIIGTDILLLIVSGTYVLFLRIHFLPPFPFNMSSDTLRAVNIDTPPPDSSFIELHPDRTAPTALKLLMRRPSRNTWKSSSLTTPYSM